MSYIPKVWQVRQGTNLNKFTKSSETSTSVILQNAPDAISIPGTPFTAAAMNNIEAGIQNTHVLGPWEKAEFATGLSQPKGITVTGPWVFATDYSAGTIKKVVIDTGIVTEFATGLSHPHGITTDGTYLYVADTGSYTIKKININTGAIATLVSGLGLIWGITTDGAFLYVTEYDTGKIKKVDISTGVTTELTTGLSYPGGITIKGAYLYVTEIFDGRIKKISLNTGAFVTVVDGLDAPCGITTDSVNLYVTEPNTGKVKKIDLSAGAITEIITGYTDPQGISIDGAILYVAEFSTGKIKTLAPTAEYIAPSKILTQSVTTANVTVTEDRFGNILLSGALTGNRDVVLPSTVRVYKVINNCTGNYYVTIKTASGTGVYSAPGDIWDVYCDGINIKPIRMTRKSAVLIAGTPNVLLAANSETKILSLSASNDALGEWGATNNRFIVKNAGLLSISIRGQFISVTGRLYENHSVWIAKNGVVVQPCAIVYVDGAPGSAYNAWPTFTINIAVSANDYIEFYCSCTSSTDTHFNSLSVRITQIS